ncbi:hypothetical protein ALNOE001_19890 [Candidatus Methanobinarius endosymbioticus]|uniref:Uncharacterized protein n=1 Tax=Candidatus Methanobinarius endosymbioticus TaxID=2006182 RepID=A0A366M7W3_9EURY|nr:hypothetical protein ALNOE001_19890 [Candidatus Methanobinarius endosymbioticus]
MDTISQDKQKLLEIIQELKKDYQAGNISEDKYRYLSKVYSNRLANLDATNKIRNIQGRKNGKRPPSKPVQRSMTKASRKEGQDLVDKYVVRPKEEKLVKKNPEVSNKEKYAILAVICLIGAFLVGMSFGLFSGPQNAVPATAVMIDDTSFPDFLANASNVTTNNSGSSDSNNENIDTDISNDDSSSDNSNGGLDDGSGDDYGDTPSLSGPNGVSTKNSTD